MRGSLALDEGVFELTSLGMELHDVTARVDITPDGLVRVTGLKLR